MTRVSLYAVDGTLNYEYSALLLRRDKIEVDKLPPGDISITMEMRTPLQRAAPASLTFTINDEPANGGTVRRAGAIYGVRDLRRHREDASDHIWSHRVERALICTQSRVSFNGKSPHGPMVGALVDNPPARACNLGPADK